MTQNVCDSNVFYYAQFQHIKSGYMFVHEILVKKRVKSMAEKLGRFLIVLP